MLDEADRLMEMGFVADVTAIVEELNRQNIVSSKRCNLLLSATLDNGMSHQYLWLCYHLVCLTSTCGCVITWFVSPVLVVVLSLGMSHQYLWLCYHLVCLTSTCGCVITWYASPVLVVVLSLGMSYLF